MLLSKFHRTLLHRRLWHHIAQNNNTTNEGFIALPSLIKTNYLRPVTNYKFIKNISSMNCQLLPRIRQFSTISKEASPEQNASDNESKQNQMKSWKMTRLGLMILGAGLSIAGLTIIYETGKPTYDADGNLVEDEFSHLPLISQVFNRVRKEFTYYKKFVQEPSRAKLLPDPLTHPYIQPPYTVVLELTDVLVHPDWTYQTGWRFKKRPGVDAFLEAIAPPQFETVIYTSEQGFTAFPLLDSLDPQGFIMYRLFRDSTRFTDGHHVKDLDALNRDLSKVIVIDWNSESVKFHPENTFKIPRWSGNDNDTSLYDLAAFLKTIHATNVTDVREVLNYYRQFENPLEAFRENQRKLLAQMEEDNKMLNEKTKKWKPSFLKKF